MSTKVVLEPIILVSDKGEEVQIAVRVVAANELEDLRPNDVVGVVSDPLGLKRESLKRSARLKVKPLHQIQIRHLFFDLGRFG